MERYRQTEEGIIPRRGQRFYKEKGCWYYKTREGAAVGPFSHIHFAVASSREYIHCVRQSPKLEDVILMSANR